MKKIAILLFIFLCLAADTKVTIYPYIHWLSWIILILPFMIKDFIIKGFVISPLLYTGLFAFILGCLTSLVVAPNLETVIQILKFSLIFTTLYYFLFYNIFKLHSIITIFNLAVFVNALFLILGILNLIPTASLLTSDGRWGTILAFPGSLVKIGAIGIYINLMLMLLNNKKGNIEPLFILILSIFIVLMDGSRTGMLVLGLTMVIIPFQYFLVNNKNKTKVFIILSSMSFVIFISIVVLAPFILTSRIGNSFIKLFSASSFSNALESIDSIRFEMILSAFDKILKDPFIGHGAFSTVGGNGMVVHNTYLQVWGDFGLFGIVGLVSLYFGWIFMLPKILGKLQIIGLGLNSAMVCSSTLMLLYFVMNGMFHPYSTEFSEWIVFIIPLTICYQFYKYDLNEFNKN